MVVGCGLETSGLWRERADGGRGDMDAGIDDAGLDRADRSVGVDVPATCMPASEICNGVDDDCDGAPDEVFRCVQNLTTMCMTACSTPGRGLCNAACDGVTGACLADAEVCGNGCDDDGNGTADDGCVIGPVNDHCEGAVVLGAAGVLGGISLAGAANDVVGCGGIDVFYAFDLTQQSIVYLDTFGSTIDTSIKYAGTSCAPLPPMPTCALRSCGGRQSQLAMMLDSGRHYLAVGSADATAGTLQVTYRVVAAAGGEDIVLAGMGHTDGSTTAEPDAVRHSCPGATVGSPEDAFWWVQCPGTMRRVVANTCASQTTYDSVLYVLGPGLDVCNDDGPGACGQDSAVDFTAIGAGVFQIFVDGWNGAAGNYRLTVPMF